MLLLLRTKSGMPVSDPRELTIGWLTSVLEEIDDPPDRGVAYLSSDLRELAVKIIDKLEAAV